MSPNVALITGGAKGIGRGIALDLAAKHWKIAFCYRTSEADAKDTAAAIVERGGQASPIRCDVSDPVAAQQLVARVEQEWGQIDALINGAGPYHRVNLFDETVAGWKEMFDGNLHPIFYLAQAAAPGMKARQVGPDHHLQHGQCRSDDFSTRRDRSLHRQSRRLDPHPDPGQITRPSRHYGQCDLPGIHRFRQCAAWRTGRHDQAHSCRVHRNGGRHRGRRALSVES